MRRKPAVQKALFSDEVGKIWHGSGISQPSHLAMLADRADPQAMDLGSIADAGSIDWRAAFGADPLRPSSTAAASLDVFFQLAGQQLKASLPGMGHSPERGPR